MMIQIYAQPKIKSVFWRGGLGPLSIIRYAMISCRIRIHCKSFGSPSHYKAEQEKNKWWYKYLTNKKIRNIKNFLFPIFLSIWNNEAWGLLHIWWWIMWIKLHVGRPEEYLACQYFLYHASKKLRSLIP